MKSNRVKNIIFDLGNVLLDIDYSLTAKRLSEVTGLDINRSLMDHGETFNKFETGKIPYVVFFNYLTKISVKTALINDMLPAWNAMLLEIQPSTWSFLRSISTQYNCYILSNTNETHIQWFDHYLQKHFSKEEWYNELFKKCFYSHEIGLRKPDRSCFEYVLNDEGLIASETLFIDDTLENIESAITLGINAIHFDRKSQDLESTLQNYLK